jgi:hypothetical protein
MGVPRIKPAQFEQVPAFRETFLVPFTMPGDAEAFRTIGRLIAAMAGEYREYWPVLESHPRRELRAALADLRHLEGYLRIYLCGRSSQSVGILTMRSGSAASSRA